MQDIPELNFVIQFLNSAFQLCYEKRMQKAEKHTIDEVNLINVN